MTLSLLVSIITVFSPIAAAAVTRGEGFGTYLLFTLALYTYLYPMAFLLFSIESSVKHRLPLAVVFVVGGVWVSLLMRQMAY